MIADDTNSTPSFRTTRAGRIPELDGLRGVAILLVVITHCLNRESIPGEPKFLTQLLTFINRTKSLGWSGVDLFFVLSGFLIGMRLLETRSSPDYFRSFYARRTRRILPVFLLFLGLIALCYAFIYPAHREALFWTFANPLPWYSYLTIASMPNKQLIAGRGRARNRRGEAVSDTRPEGIRAPQVSTAITVVRLVTTAIQLNVFALTYSPHPSRPHKYPGTALNSHASACNHPRSL
jgi:Acyltransferase family